MSTFWLEGDIRTASILLSLAGLIDSLYLFVEKVTQNQAMCLPGLGDCWTVNNSKYSEIYGIPVAILGAASYLVIISLLLLETRTPQMNRFLPFAVFGISLGGTIFSAYLTYIEIFVIYAVCPFCVVSALIMLAILILTFVRIMRSEL